MFFSCADLAVPHDIMHHVVRVESSGNPYAIGVVGGRLQRQPKNLAEAVATAKMLEQKGFNFSLGLAQVNRYNLKKYGLHSYEHAFQVCPNVKAGSHILRECYNRAKDWGKSFSCYYSGNFVTGYKHGYVQKIFSSMGKGRAIPQNAIPVISNTVNTPRPMGQMPAQQANRPNLTVTANPQPYLATVSKNQHSLQDNSTAQAKSNTYKDSAAVF